MLPDTAPGLPIPYPDGLVIRRTQNPWVFLLIYIQEM